MRQWLLLLLTLSFLMLAPTSNASAENEDVVHIILTHPEQLRGQFTCADGSSIPIPEGATDAHQTLAFEDGVINATTLGGGIWEMKLRYTLDGNFADIGIAQGRLVLGTFDGKHYEIPAVVDYDYSVERGMCETAMSTNLTIIGDCSKDANTVVGVTISGENGEYGAYEGIVRCVESMLVIPESPIGVIALTGSAMATLVFFAMKKRSF